MREDYPAKCMTTGDDRPWLMSVADGGDRRTVFRPNHGDRGSHQFATQQTARFALSTPRLELFAIDPNTTASQTPTGSKPETINDDLPIV